ncbi:MAG: dipeptidase PepE [Bacteroidales bacterium]|jgi:dipeptidase E|nr:dipeptidase PepE [Bacteroidales bacterium]
MKLLLISNSTNYGESYLMWCQTQIELFCQQNGISADSNLLFFPFAGVKISGIEHPNSYDAYQERVQGVFMGWGYKRLSSIHRFKAEEMPEMIDKADCIIVGGGNTFHLFAEMYEHALMEKVREKVCKGTPYIGWSAGSNLACPTLGTTNDMPIIQPQSFNGLNLVPFQINPHYIDPNPVIDDMIKHGGETRMDRLNEYLTVNQKTTVVGLREASALWVDNDKMTLRGGKKMLVMRYGEEIYNVEPGADVSELLVK